MNRRYSLLAIGGLVFATALIWLIAIRFKSGLSETKVLTESVIQLHKASTHFPIGLLLASMAFDLAGVVFKNRGLHAAAFWSLLGGTAGAVVTLLFGILGNPLTDPTSDLTIKALRHQNVGILAAAVFGLLSVWRIAREGKMGRAEGVAYGVVLVAGAALISFTGYLGGHIYE